MVDTSPDKSLEFLKVQHAAARQAFDEESSRYRDLTERGKVYLQILTAMVAGLAVLAKSTTFSKERWILHTTFVLCATTLMMAMSHVTRSLSVGSYMIGYHEGRYPNEHAFFKAQLKCLQQAFANNFSCNDNRASHLESAHPWVLLGTALAMTCLAVSIIAPQAEPGWELEACSWFLSVIFGWRLAVLVRRDMATRKKLQNPSS